LMQSAAEHYGVDPMSGDAASLNPEQTARIVGGEATMWSEYVSPENIDSRIWPRTSAIAERFWSPQSVTDVDSMYRRLEETGRQLGWLGLTFRSSYKPMLRRMAGSDDLAALEVIADVVEPVKGYAREETSPVEPTSLMPLNRLIDAARPESKTALEFAQQVNALVAGNARAEVENQIRQWLLLWRDQTPKFQGLAAQSFLLQEVLPVSQSLSAAATSGLEALDYLDRGETAPESWRAEQLARLQQAGKPQAQVLIMVVPSIQKLVECSAGRTGVPAGPAAPK
jgi:hexosaminidase